MCNLIKNAFMSAFALVLLLKLMGLQECVSVISYDALWAERFIGLTRLWFNMDGLWGVSDGFGDVFWSCLVQGPHQVFFDDRTFFFLTALSLDPAGLPFFFGIASSISGGLLFLLHGGINCRAFFGIFGICCWSFLNCLGIVGHCLTITQHFFENATSQWTIQS